MIATGPALQTNPTAAWDHSVFETVWNESPDSISTYDLRGARVTSDATVLDPSGFDITTTPISEFAPDATAGQSGRTAVAYLRTNGGADQVALRFLDRGPVASTGIAQAGDWFAFLHGTVNPNTQETRAWFEWGLTPSLGNSTPVQVVVPAGGEVEISDEILNLESFTTYYFRLSTENASGRGLGATRAFHTLDTVIPPNPPRPTCRVPRVVGRRLGTALTLIRRAGCRVGRIRRARSRRASGRVLSQIPRGGVRVPLRVHVRLVVSKGRR